MSLPEARAVGRRHRVGGLTLPAARRLVREIAAALTAREHTAGETFAFACFDLVLNQAARAAGLTVLEPLD